MEPEPRAYAEKAMKLVPTVPKRIVTHSWGALFTDLLAAIVADALGQVYYGAVAARLCSASLTSREIAAALAEEIASEERARGARGSSAEILARLTYWVCAVSVNQTELCTCDSE